MHRSIQILLLWLLLGPSDASASSCLYYLPGTNPGPPDFDPQAIEHQARADLASFGLVADVEILAIDPRQWGRGVLPKWSLLTVRVLQFYRRPLEDDGRWREQSVLYLASQAPVHSREGGRWLVYAQPEPVAQRERRLHPDPDEIRVGGFPAPTDIEERLWIVSSLPCRAMLLGDTLEGHLQRQALARVAGDSAPTGRLQLRQTDQDPPVALPVPRLAIESLETGRRHEIRMLEGTGATISLPVGRYRIDWSSDERTRRWCETQGDIRCVVDLMGGLTQFVDLHSESGER